MEVANKTEIDVSEAKMKRAIGAKKQEGLTLQNAAKIDTNYLSTRRQGEGNKEEIRVKTEVQII